MVVTLLKEIKFFGLSVDESNDRADQSKLNIILRYVDNNLNIQTIFL